MLPLRVVPIFAAALAAPLVATVLMTAPTRAVATSTTGIVVSTAPDRSGAVPLNGQELTGDVYVVAIAPADTLRVRFFLDAATAPLRVDYSAPFDLVAPTETGDASPLHLASLTPGQHLLRARMVTPGTVLASRVSFSVGGPIFTGYSPTGGRPYAANSAWNVAIPPSPVLDANSARMLAHLGSTPAIADLYEYGFPVYDAGAATTRYVVDCVKPWGTCGLERQPVPIPAGAVPSPGSDGAMVVIDWSTRQAFDFWQARRTSSGGWAASWGTVSSIDGDGRADGATGAGLPLLGGLIRTSEIARGVIDHAMAFSTDNACRTTFRFPARKTDGASGRADCIPEGGRVQLVPSIDVAALPGIKPAEVTVGRALQKYGAYARDNGGATVGIAFENPELRSDPYPPAGLAWDYAALPHIPWQRLRVIRQWDGR